MPLAGIPCLSSSSEGKSTHRLAGSGLGDRYLAKASLEAYKILLLCILTLVVAASCRPASTPAPVVLQPQPLHFDHPFVVLPPGQLQAQIAQWQFIADPADELSIEELTAPSKNLPLLTRTLAEQDVRYLFRLLKHGYAGYGAFDASDSFDQAEVAILQELSTEPIILKNGLARLIQSHLSFIYDCHLNIGGNRFFQHWNYYYWDGLDFYKEGDRFWTWGAGGKNWLASVNGKSPDDYLKLSLTRGGDPVFRLGTLAPKQPDNFTLDLVHPDGTHESKTGSWATSPFSADHTAFSRRTEQGIPVIANRTLGGDQASLTELGDDAATLQKEPIFILDLRGNGGGNSQWAEGWVRNLTGTTPRWPFTGTELETRTTVAGMLQMSSGSPAGSPGVESYRNWMKDIDRGARYRGWSSVQFPGFSVLRNPRQLVVVLTDGRVASSGEGFLGYLRQLENVVFIGENSAGCGLFGDITRYTLPNSGMTIQLDYKIFLPTDMVNMEGKGYAPDLWVPASQALPNALAAIKKGWLQPPQ